MKVLIVEDDPATVETISLAFELRWSGTEVISTALGAEAAQLVEKESPDAVILDLGLPDEDGFKVLPEIRRFSDVPVIIVTCRGDQISVIKGLELGADDYITKPFDPMVLLSRVKSVLRRTSMPELMGNGGVVSGGNLVIDLAARRVTVDGNPVSLTATEWKLLSYLVRNEGRVVSQQTLAERLWEDEALEDTASIRKYISRLREKLGDDPHAPKVLLTEHGIGYRFVRPR